MNGWSHRIRRVAVSVVGVAAMAAIALAVPADASASTAGTSSATHGVVVKKVPTKHTDIWEW